MIDLTGKVGIVTGAASGIGKAAAELACSLGARVVLGDIDRTGVDRAARAIGDESLAVHCDVTHPGDVERMVALAVERWGRLDFLVNNAGAVGPDTYGRDTTVVDVDLDLWDQIFAVNLKGPMLGCRFAIPAMVKSGGGSIVNISSIDALTGRWGQVAYGVSKAGVNSLSQYVATTHGREGIRCNAIAPGLIMSPVAQAAYSPELMHLSASNRLIARPGEPADIAAMIAYLVSDHASFITGQVFVVDGGTLCHHPMFSTQVGGLFSWKSSAE